MATLDYREKHLLRLVRKGQDSEGWASVSPVLLPVVQKLPSELVTIERAENGGRVKLTTAGNTIVDYL
jgi:hypothetical protein